MTQRSMRAALAAAFALFALSACSGGLSGSDYPKSEVGVPAKVRSATVLAVRAVKLDGGSGAKGALAGAAAGGALGSTIGGGTEERVAAGVAGAVIGGIAGAAIERGVTGDEGMEYTLKLDETGETIAIVQGDPQPIAAVGQRVSLVYGDRVRVVPQ